MPANEPDDGEQAAESESGPASRFGRRSMLVALGAGSAIGLASRSGSVRGQEGGGDGDGTGGGGGGGGGGGSNGRTCPPCIDEYSGYLLPEQEKDGRRRLGNIDPVTTVELRVSDADVVFVEEGGGGATETPGIGTGTPTGTAGGMETGTPTGTGTPTVTGTPTGTPAGTGTPGAGADQGFPDFYFDPVGIALRPGDAVEFAIRDELHTVTAIHPRYGFPRRVPEGVPGFSSPPVLSGDSWYYRFDEPGVYDMVCLPHSSLGMVMRAVVTPEGGDVPDAYPSLPPEEGGLPPIDQRVLSAPELNPQHIVEQGPVAWTDLTGVESEPPF